MRKGKNAIDLINTCEAKICQTNFKSFLLLKRDKPVATLTELTILMPKLTLRLTCKQITDKVFAQ